MQTTPPEKLGYDRRDSFARSQSQSIRESTLVEQDLPPYQAPGNRLIIGLDYGTTYTG